MPKFRNRKDVHCLIGIYYAWSVSVCIIVFFQETPKFYEGFHHLNADPSFFVKCVFIFHVVSSALLFGTLLYGGCTWEYSSHEIVDSGVGLFFCVISFIINRFGFSLVVLAVRGIFKAASSKLHLVSFDVQPITRQSIAQFYDFLNLLEFFELIFDVFIIGLLLYDPLTVTTCIQMLAVLVLVIPNLSRWIDGEAGEGLDVVD